MGVASVPANRPDWTSEPNFPFSRTSIFMVDATTAARASAEEIAANNWKEKFANQLYYNRTEGEPFFNYAGLGHGGFPPGFSTVVNFKEFNPALYIVGPKGIANVEEVKVWYVESGTENVQAAEAAHNLQSKWNVVPIPKGSEMPVSSQIWPEGTDKEIAIYRPSTDEYWEFWKLSKFAAGEHINEYKAGYGGYTAEASKFNGIFPFEWGARATSLALWGDCLRVDDLMRVFSGGKIGHALGVNACVTAPSHLAPATRHDSSSHTPALREDTSANPAFGFVDQVPEGAWFAFPAASKPSEFSITKPLSVAVYEAIREHGLFVNDGSATNSFAMADMRVLGSPYAMNCNPFYGAVTTENTAEQLAKYCGRFLGTSGVDTTLKRFEDDLKGNGAGGLFKKMPWRNLEQLKPRTS